METYSSDHGQCDSTNDYDLVENNRRELIDQIEKGDPSAFQKLLANDLEQLQKQYQTIAVQMNISGGLTTKVLTALFAGVQAKIAGRTFAHWVTNTSAEVAIQFLRGTRTS